MTTITKPSRLLATTSFATGSFILGASAWAIIHTGQQDIAHATLTGGLALGILAGATVIGAGVTKARTLLVTSLIVCELFNGIATADRITTEREATQAVVRKHQGGHNHASKAYSAAKQRLDNATQEVLLSASKAGCKDRCVKLLTDEKIAAQASFKDAKELLEANPEPKQSATALADRIGVPAWAIDVAMALLLSIGANGLAAALIAIAAHRAAPSHSGSIPRIEQPLPSPATPDPSRPSRRGATEKDPRIVAFVDHYRAKHGRDPAISDVQAAFPGLPHSTAQRYRKAATVTRPSLRVA